MQKPHAQRQEKGRGLCTKDRHPHTLTRQRKRERSLTGQPHTRPCGRDRFPTPHSTLAAPWGGWLMGGSSASNMPDTTHPLSARNKGKGLGIFKQASCCQQPPAGQLQPPAPGRSAQAAAADCEANRGLQPGDHSAGCQAPLDREAWTTPQRDSQYNVRDTTTTTTTLLGQGPA